MQVVDSLVSALLRADGDALVMHVGEKPAVITASGAVPLTASGLTLASMDELLRDLLPVEAQQALAEFGAVEAELPPTSSSAGQRLTVVAARGGDDVWIEIRRQRGGAQAGGSRTIPAPAGDANTPSAIASPVVAARLDSDVRPASAAPPQRRPRDARWRGTSSAPGTVGRGASEAPGIVLPLSRNPVRPDPAPRSGVAPGPSPLERLLRLAAARGAEALYLFAQAPPSIRQDGDISVIEGEPALGTSEIDALLLDAMADSHGDQGESVEWSIEVPEIGRVRAARFRDQRGPGAVFRLYPSRVTSAEQLGLSREIQTLCNEPEGLLLVAGPRASGKSTLVAAMVDQINRTRREYVIALETRTTVAHENRMALVSQREVAGESGAMAAALHAARRESPDVIAVDDLATADAIAEAVDAAASGHLVIGAITAPSAAGALERLLERAPTESRAVIQAQLARALRGVITQVLLRKSAGGRVAAREVLLNGPSVAQLIGAGDLARLPLALENGRRTGMVPLTDALVGFVQSGAVDVREAWRRAPDRPGLLKALKREGIDTSFAERLA